VISFAGGVETNPVLGVFQRPITEEFGWSRAIFTLPMSIGSFAGGIAALAVGPIMDRYGSRMVMTAAVILMGAIFVLMGTMQELWHHFALQIAGRTIIASTFFMIVGVVIPKWFITKRGRAIGIAGLGERVGQIAFPVMIERILAFSSWRAAAVAMGATVWATALLPTILLLRRRPEDHGLRPDGAPPLDLRNRGAEPTAARPLAEVSFDRRAAMRVTAFWLLTSSLTIQSFITTGINFHWFSYLTDNGLSGSVAVISLSLAPLIGMPASVYSGFLAEKVPPQYIMGASYVLMSMAIGILLIADNAPLAYAFGIVYGVATGMQITIMHIIWADFFGRRSIGAIHGLIAPIHMLSNAIGPLAAALTFDVTGAYTLIFATSALLSIVAGTLISIARKPPRPQQPIEARAS
jgi:sugar phosphate permease